MSFYVLTPAAEDDARAILTYIEQDNPSIVDQVRDGLRTTASMAIRLAASAMSSRRRLGSPRDVARQSFT